MNYKGLEYLRNKLNKHKIRVEMRYKQYDMTYQEQMIGPVSYTHLDVYKRQGIKR